MQWQLHDRDIFITSKGRKGLKWVYSEVWFVNFFLSRTVWDSFKPERYELTSYLNKLMWSSVLRKVVKPIFYMQKSQEEFMLLYGQLQGAISFSSFLLLSYCSSWQLRGFSSSIWCMSNYIETFFLYEGFLSILLGSTVK